MKHLSHPLKVILLTAAAGWLAGCSTVPVSGRSQLTLIPESTLVATSLRQYDEIKKSTPISTNREQTAMLNRVGGKISQAVERYLRDNGMGDRVADFAWEFTLFESKEINAWAMPGGKIAFYTGILPLCQDDTGVAVVMAHEIAHVVARHGAERLSQQLLAGAGGLALAVALRDQTPTTQAAWLGAYGAGATVGIILPYSRRHEYEADHLGLVFMAMAGYDPRAAVDFWTRMQQAGSGGKPPEFLSTHPSDAKRIEYIKSELPNALRHYRQN